MPKTLINNPINFRREETILGMNWVYGQTRTFLCYSQGNLMVRTILNNPFLLPAEEVWFLWYNREKAAKAKRVGNGLGTD
jgi:hypothetical protein